MLLTKQPLRITRADMESLFDPVVQQVIRLVTQQVDHIAQTKGKRINVRFSPVGLAEWCILTDRSSCSPSSSLAALETRTT